jgi:hypothetical protein
VTIRRIYSRFLITSTNCHNSEDVAVPGKNWKKCDSARHFQLKDEESTGELDILPALSHG